MGLYDSMKTNERLEKEGIWLDLGHTRIKLGRAGGKNTKFVSAMEKVVREHKRTLDFMDDVQGRKLFNKVYAETIILDWLTKREDGTLDEQGRSVTQNHEGDKYVRGIEDADGVIQTFTPECVIQTLLDLPDLAVVIKETAEDSNLFKDSLVKDIVGN